MSDVIMNETLPVTPAAAPSADSTVPQTPTIQQIRARLDATKGQAYWRGLDELADTPAFQAFMASEFPRQAAPLESSLQRRDFLKLLGASLALAAFPRARVRACPTRESFPTCGLLKRSSRVDRCSLPR